MSFWYYVSLHKEKITQMKFSGFIKLPNHRVFNYEPRYYNPAKEEREKKLQAKDAEKRIKISDYYYHKKKYSKRDNLMRRIIISVTFILLLTILYIIFDFVGFIFK